MAKGESGVGPRPLLFPLVGLAFLVVFSLLFPYAERLAASQDIHIVAGSQRASGLISLFPTSFDPTTGSLHVDARYQAVVPEGADENSEEVIAYRARFDQLAKALGIPGVKGSKYGWSLEGKMMWNGFPVEAYPIWLRPTLDLGTTLDANPRKLRGFVVEIKHNPSPSEITLFEKAPDWRMYTLGTNALPNILDDGKRSELELTFESRPALYPFDESNLELFLGARAPDLAPYPVALILDTRVFRDYRVSVSSTPFFVTVTLARTRTEILKVMAVWAVLMVLSAYVFVDAFRRRKWGELSSFLDVAFLLLAIPTLRAAVIPPYLQSLTLVDFLLLGPLLLLLGSLLVMMAKSALGHTPAQ